MTPDKGRCYTSDYGGHFEILDQKKSKILVDTKYNNINRIKPSLDLKVVKTVLGVLREFYKYPSLCFGRFFRGNRGGDGRA